MTSHGHGDHAAHEAKRLKDTYILATIIWVAVIVAAFALYKKGTARLKPAPAHPHAARHIGVRHVTGAHRQRPATKTTSPKAGTPAWRRVREANTWQARMRKNGHALRARAQGKSHTTFEIRFPAELGSAKNRAMQREEITKLRKATPFFSRLRSLGFQRLALRVGRRPIFSRTL
ncbi:MAG: hypothetical protein KAI47_00765 [Deltaproteobacteria bacterium]|nr:hypothetical protein [Deltaproteobacteria bacterium]